jgi:hypothetical protein
VGTTETFKINETVISYMHGEGREANSLLFAVHSILIHVAIDLHFYMNNCPKKCSNGDDIVSD